MAEEARTLTIEITRFDPDLVEIVLLSLQISLSAVVLATLVSLPIGAALAVFRFRGRGAVIVLLNALMGLPPVVVGLILYLLLSRAGPLGEHGLLRVRIHAEQPEHHADQRGADDPGDDAPHLDLAPEPPVGSPHAGEQIITMLLIPVFRLFFPRSKHQAPLYDEQRDRPY